MKRLFIRSVVCLSSLVVALASAGCGDSGSLTSAPLSAPMADLTEPYAVLLADELVPGVLA